ncbi:MAG: beta-lactamase family protein [Actinomycetota bacterium]|nr:beta-lactamase family protein [Actinomycetota bacterium]
MVVAVAGCDGAKQPSPSRDGPVAPGLARKLQRVFDQQREFYELPGAAAALVIPGKGTWSAGSGVADRQSATRVTARTRFAIASVTKVFVGALALKLAQEGRVSFEEPLGRTLPRWPHAERITLRHLLRQTSGISRFDGLGSPVFRAIERDPGAHWSPRRVLSWAKAPSFAPGKRWEYNNTNYLLAGLVLEHATDEPVAAALRREILDPLGLRDVVLQPQQRPRSGAAHGYGPSGGGRREHDLADGSGFVPFRSVASASWTAGGIVASAPSVAKFGDAVLRGELLGRAAREQMTNFQDTGGAPEYPSWAFGMGRALWSRLSGPVWVAFGATPGFGSTLAHLPANGITVAVLANRDDSTRLTAAIAEILIETATQDP